MATVRVAGTPPEGLFPARVVPAVGKGCVGHLTMDSNIGGVSAAAARGKLG